MSISYVIMQSVEVFILQYLNLIVTNLYFFINMLIFLVYILISDDHLADELDTNGSILLPCWHKYVYLCIYF